jgi:hypothetical protein
MDGKEVSGPSLDRGVVFQNYSLLPWLSRAEERDLSPYAARSGLVDREQVLTHSEEASGDGRAERERVPPQAQPAVGRHAPARLASPGRFPSARNCCCWMSRSARSMR